jgi:hypothetical protein
MVPLLDDLLFQQMFGPRSDSKNRIDLNMHVNAYRLCFAGLPSRLSRRGDRTRKSVKQETLWTLKGIIVRSLWPHDAPHADAEVCHDRDTILLGVSVQVGSLRLPYNQSS